MNTVHARNFGWLVGDKAFRLLISLISSVVVARYLGPAQFGPLSLGITIVMLAAPFASLGLVQIVTRDLVLHPTEAGAIIGTTWGLRLLGAILAGAVAVVGAMAWRPDDQVLHLLVLILVTRLFSETFVVLTFWFESRVQSKFVVRANLFGYSVSFAAKMAVVLADGGLAWMAAAFALEAVAIAAGWIVAFGTSYPGPLHPRFEIQRAKHFLRRSWPLFLSAFGAIIYLKIDQVMIGYMLSDTAVGIYAVAAQLSEVWYFVPVAIMASVFPDLLKQGVQDRQLYYRTMQKLIDMLFMMALAVAIATTIMSSFIIELLYGAAYAEAAPVLAIHIWGGVFIFMRAVLSKWIIAEEVPMVSLLTQVGGGVLNVVGNLLLIPAMGIKGAAVATVLSYAAASYFFLLPFPKCREIANLMTRSMCKPITLPVLLVARLMAPRRVGSGAKD